MNVNLALAVLALFNSLAVLLVAALGLTWLIHALLPGIAHPWHPYVPWGFIVSLGTYCLLPGTVRTKRVP